MAGLIAVSPPPGARTAAVRSEAHQALRLLREGRAVSTATSYAQQAQAYNAARTLVRRITTHTGLPPGQLRRTVWQVSNGPHAGRWRYAVLLAENSSALPGT